MQVFRLDTLCDIRSGGTPPRGNPDNYGGAIPWVKISDIEAANGNLSSTEETITDHGLKSIRGRIFPAGTLLFAIYGSVGKSAFAQREVTTNQAILGIQILDADVLHPRYLYRWLQSQQMVFENESQGIAQKNLSAGYVRSLEIPLPPLEEQKRIAAILDQADDIRRKRQHAIERLNQLGQAIFHEMFGDKAASKEGHVKLGQISERVTKGESPKWQGHSYVDDGALFVTSENVGWGTLLKKEPKFVPLEFHNGKLARSKLKPDDILINLVGASIGRACIFYSEYGDANINQAVSVVTLNKNHKIQNYILSYILSPWGQEQILGSRVEGARANISLQDVREFSLYLPSAHETAQFDERIGAMAIVQQENMVSIEQSKNLFTSLQHRAFTGQL